MSEKPPIIDLADALNRAMGDVDFLKMMLEEFQQMIPEFVSKISQAVHYADMDNLGQDAHQFKGTAANLGAKDIAACALELERIGKTGAAEKSQAAYDKLAEAVKTFEQHYNQIDWSTVSP